ncbi:unnamed protein product [Ectocarpus sp. CCAP 1310/34]|nr:unnamed protein product [Ectocarpus sp. CCAP 1310/34]
MVRQTNPFLHVSEHVVGRSACEYRRLAYTEEVQPLPRRQHRDTDVARTLSTNNEQPTGTFSDSNSKEGVNSIGRNFVRYK